MTPIFIRVDSNQEALEDVEAPNFDDTFQQTARDELTRRKTEAAEEIAGK